MITIGASDNSQAEAALGFGIKEALGKLVLPHPADPWLLEACEQLDATVLPLLPEVALAAAALPMHHRDPFDRLLVAQARQGFTLVTRNTRIAAYDVATRWA